MAKASLTLFFMAALFSELEQVVFSNIVFVEFNICRSNSCTDNNRLLLTPLVPGWFYF